MNKEGYLNKLIDKFIQDATNELINKAYEEVFEHASNANSKEVEQNVESFTVVNSHHQRDRFKRQQQMEKGFNMSYRSASPSWQKEISNRFRVLQNHGHNYEGTDWDNQGGKDLCLKM